MDGRGTTELRRSRSRSASCRAPTAPGSSPAARPRSSRSRRSARLGRRADRSRSARRPRRSYIHHYNFPPYSARREASRMRWPEPARHRARQPRRAVADPGAPADEDFPYVIRLVSEVPVVERLDLDGVATCGSTLALMDAGVPICALRRRRGDGPDQRAGRHGSSSSTDILGKEDLVGDMDFKVTGTRDGITGPPDGHQGPGASTRRSSATA